MPPSLNISVVTERQPLSPNEHAVKAFGVLFFGKIAYTKIMLYYANAILFFFKTHSALGRIKGALHHENKPLDYNWNNSIRSFACAAPVDEITANNMGGEGMDNCIQSPGR